MPRTAQTKGRCGYCGREMTSVGTARHLKSCAERRKATEQANRRSGQTERLHHLQVRDGYGLGYWLHLEMSGSATLFELDFYLRRIWLECCGHMSAFKIHRVQYMETFEDSFVFGECESLDVTADAVFEPGLTFTHEYDFGTTTDLALRVLDQRRGKPTTGHAVALMARNDPLRIPCETCGRPARALCLDCCYQRAEDRAGYVCDDHVAAHAEHNDYGKMAIFNSPRTGVCGYDGPAVPPY